MPVLLVADAVVFRRRRAIAGGAPALDGGAVETATVPLPDPPGTVTVPVMAAPFEGRENVFVFEHSVNEPLAGVGQGVAVGLTGGPELPPPPQAAKTAAAATAQKNAKRAFTKTPLGKRVCEVYRYFGSIPCGEKMRNSWLLALLFASAAAVSAAAADDGAIITNSGSTNTLGYAIKVWSNGNAQITMKGSTATREFRIDDDLVARLFNDVKGARANPGVPGHCMKSASFGTTTAISWHDYNSYDLQCPPQTSEVATLAQDVKLVEAAANIDTRLRRFPLPHEVRMIPTATPEVTPT